MRYTDELKAYLTSLSTSELTDVIDFYTEYILDSNLDTYEAIVKELGSPRQLSHKILADYSIKDVSDEDSDAFVYHEPKPKKNIRMIWLVLLAIFAAPVALPVAVSIFGVLLGMVICVFAMVVAIFVMLLAFFLGGFITFLAGLVVWSQSFATALLFMGLGLALIGISLILLTVGHLIVKGLIQITANFSQFIYHRFIHSQHHQKEVN